MLTVTLMPAVVTTLPYWSQTWAVTVPRLLPALMLRGCVVMLSVEAAPAVTVNLLDVTLP